MHYYDIVGLFFIILFIGFVVYVFSENIYLEYKFWSFVFKNKRFPKLGEFGESKEDFTSHK